MKVKIFSVRADENFRAIRVGDETRKLLGNGEICINLI